MKRGFVVFLLIMLAGMTAWAGVRWDFDAGMSSGAQGSATLIAFALDQELTTDVDDTAEEIAADIIDAPVQTPSLTAILDAWPVSAMTGESIVLDATGSRSGGRMIVLYEWDTDADGVFDEESETGTLATTYEEDGSVAAIVRVTDDQGESSTSEPVHLNIVNRSPVAVMMLATDLIAEGDELQFDDASTDADGTIRSWLWSFGDGTTSGEASPSHAYEQAGRFTVSLLVTDNDGAVSTAASTELRVANIAPEAGFSVRQDEAAIVLLDESFDPSPNGKIVHVAWDFGDDTYLAGSPAKGSVYTHTYAQPGTYVITLYVIDSHGAMTLSTATVQVL